MKEQFQKWSRNSSRLGLERKDWGVKRFGDRVIAFKLVLEEDINIISAYAPQARSYEIVKRQFGRR